MQTLHWTIHIERNHNVSVEEIKSGATANIDQYICICMFALAQYSNNFRRDDNQYQNIITSAQQECTIFESQWWWKYDHK